MKKLWILLLAVLLTLGLCACGGDEGDGTTVAPDAPTGNPTAAPGDNTTEGKADAPTTAPDSDPATPPTDEVTTATPTVDMSGVTFEDLTVAYDGQEKTIQIGGTLPQGVTVTYTGAGTVPGAYTVTATFTAPAGYAPIPDMTATLTVTKGVADLSGVTLTNKTVTYDGNAHSIEIEGTLPQGITVSYTGNEKTLPGSYTVTASFSGEYYEDIPNMTAKLKIEKAVVDMSGISFRDLTIAYDGDYHSLVIEGDLPEGVTVEYEGQQASLAGEYTFTAKFTAPEGYATIPNMTATLTIEEPTHRDGPSLYVDEAKTFLYSVDPGLAAASLAIPDTVTRIAPFALYNMSALQVLYVPSSVEVIGSRAFGYAEVGGEDVLVEGFVVYGAAGSAVETWCQDKGIAFKAENPMKTYHSASDFLLTEGLIATFDAMDPTNASVKLTEGKWYAKGSTTVYATLRGGATWWKARQDGGIGYDMTQGEYDSNYKNVGISLPVSLLNEGGYTVQTTLIAFGPKDNSSDDGRYYHQSGQYGYYKADNSAFTFGHIRTLQFAGHFKASVFETRWFYHKEPWDTHQTDGNGIHTGGELSANPVAKTLTVTGAKTAEGTMNAAAYINSQRIWAFDSATHGIYKTYLPLSEGGELSILAGYPGTVYSIRIYNRVLTGDEIAQNHMADILSYYDISLTKYGALFPEQVEAMMAAVGNFDFTAEKAEVEAALDAALMPKYNVILNIEYVDEDGAVFDTERVVDYTGTSYVVPSPTKSGYYTRDLFVAGVLTESKTVTVEYRKIPKMASPTKVRMLVPGVVCWGDSITAGAGGGNVTVAQQNGIDLVSLGSSATGAGYVAVLDNLIKTRTGSTNGAINCGVGGETSAVIAARAMTETYYLYLGEAVAVGANGSAIIDIQQYASGGRLGILRQGEGNKSINNVQITGTDADGNPVTVEGRISIAWNGTGKSQAECEYENLTYTFTRTDTKGGTVILPKNAKIVTNGSHAYDDHWLVLFIGTNGGYTNWDELIKQQQEMIDASNCGDKYVIIGLSNGNNSNRGDMEAKMKAKWGDHYFSAREFISSEECYRMVGFGDDVIAADQSMITSGTVSRDSYLIDGVHLNAVGYAALGNRLFLQIWQLGFFDALFDYYDSFYAD